MTIDRYSNYLKSPKWQKKRLEILQRDNWTCQICFSDIDELHIHHLQYFPRYKPWEYPNNLLLTVCNICHEFISFYNYNEYQLQIISFNLSREKDCINCYYKQEFGHCSCRDIIDIQNGICSDWLEYVLPIHIP